MTDVTPAPACSSAHLCRREVCSDWPVQGACPGPGQLLLGAPSPLFRSHLPPLSLGSVLGSVPPEEAPGGTRDVYITDGASSLEEQFP